MRYRCPDCLSILVSDHAFFKCPICGTWIDSEIAEHVCPVTDDESAEKAQLTFYSRSIYNL